MSHLCDYCEAPWTVDGPDAKTCTPHEFLADDSRPLCTRQTAPGGGVDSWCSKPVTHVDHDGAPWCAEDAPSDAIPVTGDPVRWPDVYAAIDGEDDDPRHVRVLARFLDVIGHPLGMAWPAKVAWAAGWLVLLSAAVKVVLAVAG